MVKVFLEVVLHDFSKAMSNVLDLIIWLFDLNILLLIIMRLLFRKTIGIYN